ncbi:MAG: hypothetical protein R2780_11145 [Crocinitomicaceae bacterium]|nr:hypothetical protein [Crocinitomicaceae bacterium]
MKKYLVFGSILLLFSCKKKYEEKAGDFIGGELTASGTYEDTLTFNLVPATYSLVYYQPSRTYGIISSTGNLPEITFARKEFKDNNATKAGVSGGVGGWDVTLEGNKLSVVYENFTFSSWNTIAFDGEKQ